MNRLIERCGMLDIHKSQITACVRVPDDAGGRRQEIREFASTTSGLLTLADWLRSWSVTVVGMESTGVYWRPVFYLLEDEFECRLYNARHLRHVPGRKSDVQDAEWGCQLIEHGLVRASFVPPRPLRELRDLVRYRKAKIQERTREVQRVEKTLQDAGIKLSSVASEVLGVSARRMLDALISGTHDPEILAELAKGKLRKKIPALREALQGRFTGHHALLISQMLAQIDFLDETIATLSEQIEELTRPFSRELELLDTIPGIDRRAAELLLAEIGPDMSRFPPNITSPPGAGCAPASANPAARSTPPRPARAPSGCAEPSPNPPRASSAPRAPTSRPATTGSKAAAGTPKPRPRPPTRSSPPPTTSSPKACPTTNSVRNSSTAATPRTPNATADASSTSSNASATKSPSNPYPRRPNPTRHH